MYCCLTLFELEFSIVLDSFYHKQLHFRNLTLIIMSMPVEKMTWDLTYLARLLYAKEI